MADAEKAATYAAEDRLLRWARAEGPVRVFASTWDVEPLGRFNTLADVQAYVERALARAAEHGTYGRAMAPVTVRARRGGRKAHYEAGGVMAVPVVGGTAGWAMNELVVLHELGHHLVPGQGHDDRFRGAVVDLLAWTGHPVLASLLRIAYQEEDLVVTEGDR